MFDQLKTLMQSGERYIIVEGGRPEYVLMRFPDYALLAGRRDFTSPLADSRHVPPPEHRGEWERANVELEEVSASEPMARTIEFGTPLPASDPTTIRLEDLPL